MNGYNTPGDNPKNQMRKNSEGGKSVAFKKGGSAHAKHENKHMKKNDSTHHTTVEKSGDMGKLHTHAKSGMKSGHTFYADSHEDHAMCSGGSMNKK